ncbi:MAG: hypothetical protein AAFU64_04610 [Bacteroidota bacterium]
MEKTKLKISRWGFDQAQYFIIRTDINLKRWREFIYESPKGGSLIYLSNSGHFLHRDDVEAFLANIKVMYHSIKKNN